ASDGFLLRLWRPPLQPGEWRTLGLFAAGGHDPLDAALASMPLRAGRQDEVTPLSPHPHDPEPLVAPPRARPEFLTTLTLTMPPETSGEAIDAMVTREAERARDLAAEGHLRRLWRLPDGRGLGLWRADGSEQMSAILVSLPLDPWLSVETMRLT